MKMPMNDEALTALAKELAALYAQTNGLASDGHFDQMLVTVVEHAMTYAFRIGYRTRVAEETAEERSPS